MGNITIQGDLTGDVPGGEVGGASNLTTVGAIPYVSASGTLNQDPTALFWDAANNRLGVGTASPLSLLHVESTGGALARFAYNSTYYLAVNENSIDVYGGNQLAFKLAGSEKARIAATTGNLLIGTTTDSNFKLDVAASGSSGTARFYGGAGVSDITSAVVRSGGGQANNSSFSVRNASDAGFISFDPEANVAGVKFGYARMVFGDSAPLNHGTMSSASAVWNAGTNMVSLGSSYVLRWFTGTSFTGLNEGPTSNVDLSLSRASAGVLQVGDGGANANGYLSAARIGVGTASPGSVLDIRAAGSGTVGPTLSLINSAASFVGNAADINMAGNPGGGPLAPTGRIRLTEGVNAAGTFSFWTYDGSGGASGFNEKMTIGPDGVVQIYNNRATTGVTKAVIRAGAGQSTTSLTEWQNSAGTTLASVSATGALFGSVLYVGTGADGEWGPSALKLKSNQLLGWVNGSNATGTADTALARNAAGVLEVNNGTAGTYRDILARRHQASGETVASLPAAAAGNAGTISYVTDANATTIGSTVAGGGANKVLVWSNGTAWKIFAN